MSRPSHTTACEVTPSRHACVDPPPGNELSPHDLSHSPSVHSPDIQSTTGKNKGKSKDKGNRKCIGKGKGKAKVNKMVRVMLNVKTRSSAIAGRPCDAKACQGLLKWTWK